MEAVYEEEQAEAILEGRLEKKIEGLYDLGVQIIAKKCYNKYSRRFCLS